MIFIDEENPKILAIFEQAAAHAAQRTPEQAAQAAKEADVRLAAMQAEIDAEDAFTAAQIAAFEDTFLRGLPMKKIDPPDSNIIPFSWAQKPKNEPLKQKPLHQKLFDLLMTDEQQELERIAQQPQLIDGVLPAQSFGVLYGESGTGKSFIALDMAMSIACGIPWHGHDTELGQVVYVSAEGGNSFRIRKKAWEQYRAVTAPLMRVLPLAVALNNAHELTALRSALDGLVKITGSPIKLIIIDTLARSLIGDENTAKDMSSFVSACDTIKAEFGATVIVVHHTGKDIERGARGSSALRAACDFEILVGGHTASFVTVKCTKSKDLSEFKPLTISFEHVELDDLCNYKGNPIKTLVPRIATFGEEMSASIIPTDREQIILDILRSKEGDIHLIDAIRSEFYQHPKIASMTKSNRQKTFKRCVEGLSTKFLIGLTENEITIEK